MLLLPFLSWMSRWRLSLFALRSGERPIRMDAGYGLLASRTEARFVSRSFERVLRGIGGLIEQTVGRRLGHHEYPEGFAIHIRGRQIVSQHRPVLRGGQPTDLHRSSPEIFSCGPGLASVFRRCETDVYLAGRIVAAGFRIVIVSRGKVGGV